MSPLQLPPEDDRWVTWEEHGDEDRPDEDPPERDLMGWFDHVQELLNARGREPFELSGAIVLRQVDDKSGVEVLDAPDHAAITLELLAAADPALLRIAGDVITLANVVDYRVVGWDPSQRAVLVDLVDDRRDGR